MATKRNDRLITDFRADDNDPANGASGSVIMGTPNPDTLNGGNGKDRIEARAGNDLLRGGNGKDELYGQEGNDELNGGNGKDLLDGGPGDDILMGENGNDLLIGGSGIDRAVFDFSFAQARFDYSTGGLAVSGPSSGTDQLIGIERIQFSDRIIDAVDDNPLVDDIFYLATYRDVAASGQDPDAHYAEFGFREGRDPNAFFSTTGYLAANPDVRAAGVNPLTHYSTNGFREGRDPGANFDNEFYYAANPDVRAAGVNPLAHYLQFGESEGRAINEAIGRAVDISAAGGFDAEFYLLSNLDVARAAISAGGDSFAFARNHFNTNGFREGRDPNEIFDTDGYLNAYRDVRAAGVNPLTHYIQNGAREGRDPSVEFDTTAYLAANPDVRAVGINPMQHYLQFGIYEGRSPQSDTTFGIGSVG